MSDDWSIVVNPTTVSVAVDQEETPTAVVVSIEEVAVTVEEGAAAVVIEATDTVVAVLATTQIINVAISASQETVQVTAAPIIYTAPTVTFISAENKEGDQMNRLTVVAVHSSGSGIVKAQANNMSRPVLGFLLADTPNTVAGDVQTEEVLEANDWTDCCGTVELVRGPYFLDAANPGKMTNTAPATDGQISQEIGQAISPTQFDISIQPPVLL